MEAVETAIKVIDGLAPKGVSSFDSLKERFNYVSKYATRATWIPDGSDGMWWHALAVPLSCVSTVVPLPSRFLVINNAYILFNASQPFPPLLKNKRR